MTTAALVTTELLARSSLLILLLTAAACGGESESAASGGGSSVATSQSGTGSTPSSSASAGEGGEDGNGASAGGGSPTGGAGSGGAPQGVVPGPVDAIIAAMAPGTWRKLPATPMKDVCPPPFHNYFCWSVIGAWGGGTWDPNSDRMLVWGGGHADSYYNNIFAFDLGQMRWSRLTEMPEGADGQQPTAAMNQVNLEPCSLYPTQAVEVPPELLIPSGLYVAYEHCDHPAIAPFLDEQQPRSAHTYNALWFDAPRDRFCYLGGAQYPSGQSTSPRAFCFDMATKTWSRTVDFPESYRGPTALDADGQLWVFVGMSGHLDRYDPAADSWSLHAGTNGLSGIADVDRTRNQLVGFEDGTGNLLRWDLAQPDVAHEVIVPGGDPTNLPGRPGFVYADPLDRFVAWGAGRAVYALDPETWEWRRDDVDAGDDPGAPQTNGTYGRWRYSARGVFVLVNDTNQDVHIYKPSAAP